MSNILQYKLCEHSTIDKILQKNGEKTNIMTFVSQIPKRATTAKPKIKYIAPRPTIKKKEEEIIDTTVYDRLYKVDVYTGESGINAKVLDIRGVRDNS